MTRKLSLCALVILLAAGPAMAQRRGGGQRSEGAPQRPAGTYGQPGNRPEGAPQRPAGVGGQTGSRPENAPQRPAESRGQRGNRPVNAPQRPAGTTQTPGLLAAN